MSDNLTIKGRLTALVVGTLLFIILGEVSLNLFYPQRYFRPAHWHSPLYGHILPKDAIITHGMPGSWRFTYSVNEYGYRGEPTAISNTYDKVNIIVLGDSNSFGIGVNDGEEYPSVLAVRLSDRFDVINLAVGGYGLTQQIRRYYEFGKLYNPGIVIIQFSANDPADNLVNKVTIIEDGKFRFQLTYKPTAWLNTMLANSVIQYSQLYSLLRKAYHSLRKRHIIQQVYAVSDARRSSDHKRQTFYNELLDMFVKDLSRNGVTVLYISANNKLALFPKVKNMVLQLHREGRLQYIEVADWFEGIEDYGSSEGHIWGVKGHKIIGKRVAKIILQLRASEDRLRGAPPDS